MSSDRLRGRPLGSPDRTGACLRAPRVSAVREIRRRVGICIRRARESRNVSASELAEACDTSSSLVYRYERGVVLPPLPRLWQLAAALRMTLEQLLAGDF